MSNQKNRRARCLVPLLAWGVLLLAGCAKKSTEPAAFLDETKALAASLEWNREIECLRDSGIRFVVDGGNELGITLVKSQAWEAMLAGDSATMKKIGIEFTENVVGTFDREFALEKGKYYIIIENQSTQGIDVRLRCF